MPTLRKIIIVLLVGILFTACAKRPKEHLPQPDKSAKSEVRNVIYALFDACRAGDNKRIEKAFSEGWYLLDDDGQISQQTADDAVAQLKLIMTNYKNKQYSDDIIKLNVIPVDDVIISNSDELDWLSQEETKWLDPISEFMEKEDLLLSFYGIPLQDDREKVRIMFNFLLGKESGRWMIKLMHMQTPKELAPKTLVPTELAPEESVPKVN